MEINNGVPNEIWIVFVKSNKRKIVRKNNYKIVSDYSEGYSFAMDELKKPQNNGNSYYVEKFKHIDT